MEGNPCPFEPRATTASSHWSGVAIANPDIAVMPDVATSKMTSFERRYYETRADIQPSLILGMRELIKLHIYIAYHEKMLYFSPAADRNAAPASH